MWHGFYSSVVDSKETIFKAASEYPMYVLGKVKLLLVKTWEAGYMLMELQHKVSVWKE